MKQKTFLALLLGALLSLPAAGQYAESATEEVYDFSGYSDATLLELFYQAYQAGRMFPTVAEFEQAGIQQSDLAFVRSHVRPRAILDRAADALVPELLNKERNLWLNLPMDDGQDGLAGYPRARFHSDVFSMWQYCNLYGSWNHGIFQAPGAWVDAAHRNGTDIMSGIKFFDVTGGAGLTANSYLNTIFKKDAAGNMLKDADGYYAYVKPLVHLLMFLGSDGINYNWEASGYSDADVLAFHRQLYKYSAEVGFSNFHAGLYTSNQGFSAYNMANLYGSPSTGQTWDFFGNYSGGDFAVGSATVSVQAAQSLGWPLDDAYQGVWICHMNRNWTGMNTASTAPMNICLWGEHGRSRFFQFTTGKDSYDTQRNYQYMLEAGFSGGYRNPARRPTLANTGNNFRFQFDEDMNMTSMALSTFGGLATLIPERSAIQGDFSFLTHFNLGNGVKYVYKGVPTAGEWYNMSAQDVVPTYRWLTYDAGTTTTSDNIVPEFNQFDAYIGGSCLRLAGTAKRSGTDVILYKTSLTVSHANPTARLAVKTYQEGTNDCGLSLLLRRAGSDEWDEYPLGEVEGAGWVEKSIALGYATGTVVDRIALRLRGDGDCNISVGMLSLSDDATAVPAPVKDVTVEVKEETQRSMSFKIHWGVDAEGTARSQYGMLYNDEANISHFEILYKNGEAGRPQEIGRTSQWATYVGNLPMTADEDPFIGVRPASTDQKTYGDVQWVHVARADASLLPEESSATADTYGKSEIDPAADGYETACQSRYIETLLTSGATENLNYHASSTPADGTQYVHVTDQKLVVQQGQTVELFWKAYNDASDGLRWCVTSCWIDLDGSGDFYGASLNADPAYGEMLYRMGVIEGPTVEFQTTGITHTFKIPEDAAVGPSRMRLVFADAWFAGTLAPTGLTSKGFTIDFDVEIQGDEALSREPLVQTTFQSGEAPLPEGVTWPAVEDGIQTARTEGVSRAAVRGEQVALTNVEKAWIYTADGKFVKFAQGNPSSISMQGCAPGVYLIKMENQNVVRSQKIVVR